MTAIQQNIRVRCPWATSELNIPYHDEEWGVPVHDEHTWFEFLILEGAQAGLSWDTILRKRARYREVFDAFDPAKVARYDKKKVRELLRDAGIIRNRLKIDATIGNARAFLEVQKEFGTFDAYIWRFERPSGELFPVSSFVEMRVGEGLACVGGGASLRLEPAVSW